MRLKRSASGVKASWADWLGLVREVSGPGGVKEGRGPGLCYRAGLGSGWGFVFLFFFFLFYFQTTQIYLNSNEFEFKPL